MKVLSAEFVTSAASAATGIPQDSLPRIALAGRSNVGKSSLINALTRRRIARTSAAPGKTRLVNVYRVDLEGASGRECFGLYLVDLPGYGYARGGADAAVELQAIAEAYFSRRPPAAGRQSPVASRQSRATLLLVDSRHPRLEADLQAAGWLGSMGVETHIVATKIDKLSRSERARNLKALGNSFGTAALPVSAASGEGLDELWRMIVRIVKDAGRRE